MIIDKTTSELSIKDINTLCQHYLDILYSNTQTQNTHPNPKSEIGETYGEVLYPSIDKLLAELTLTQRDIFVDFGSGLGKMVTQVFLKSPVKEAYGVEILPKLHQQAISVAQTLENDLPIFYNDGRKLTFLLGSFLEIPLPTATVVMIVATCFPQSLLNALGKIIEGMPSIHTVLSLRPMSTLRRLNFKKTIRIECSWDTTLCYMYTRKC